MTSELRAFPELLQHQVTRYAWHLRQLALDRWTTQWRTGPQSQGRLQFVSLPGSIMQSQIFPFYHYRAAIEAQSGMGLAEVRLENFRRNPGALRARADVVCLQTWFDLTTDDLSRLIDMLRSTYPGARIVYLDWFAPTDLRYAEALDSLIDVYVKKHVFRDRSRYGEPTRGDTNLCDYYGRRYGIEMPRVRFHVPPSFMKKLVIGPSFAAADYMLHRFIGEPPPAEPRPIDLHARISAKGENWYHRMRLEAIDQVNALRGVQQVVGDGVSRSRFLRELMTSKMCFSPFGYGEVCWRDYESIMCGALLIKPDMSHVETVPDVFLPYETYVPVRWDFSDLAEKVKYYLSAREEREAISRRAFEVLQRYFRGDSFVRQVQPLFEHQPATTLA